ncbi:hypothetical protein VTP01DRAFT_8805 [Rhizomucor pusillus]|uniref:uncharacterized protein n=1 Tax=Rhizomucor pusillus TaxID=4840 RepID=UPI003742E024
MVKESGPPKAINIIRPTHSLSSRRRHAAPAELTESRKPKVASAAKISISSTNKHQLNIFHPPSRPQHHQQQPQKQPGSYEIYRPRSNLSRSLTTPSVSSSSSSSAAATARRPHYIPPTSASHNIISNTAPRPLTRSKTIVPAVSDASSSSSSKNAQASDSETTLRSSSNSGGGSSEDEDDDDDDSEDDKKQQGQSDDNEVEDDEISEARVNRKIADLEISNRSLLAVNEMLEMTVRKQASQVAKLKKQISQGDFPPPQPLLTPVTMEVDGDEDDNDWEKDEQFHRLYKLTQRLIEEGEASLKFQYKNLGRVISQYSDLTDELDTLASSEPSSMFSIGKQMYYNDAAA